MISFVPPPDSFPGGDIRPGASMAPALPSTPGPPWATDFDRLHLVPYVPAVVALTEEQRDSVLLRFHLDRAVSEKLATMRVTGCHGQVSTITAVRAL